MFNSFKKFLSKIYIRLKLFKKYFYIHHHYPVNKDYTDIVKFFIANKNSVTFISLDEYNLTLKYNNYYYCFWISNKWYAYLNRVSIAKDVLGTHLNFNNVFDELSCDPEVMFKFYETFERPNIKENVKNNKLKSFKTNLILGLDNKE